MTSSEDEPAEIPTEPESITATSANNDETIENEESSPSPLFASESDADPSPDGLLPSASSSQANPSNALETQENTRSVHFSEVPNNEDTPPPLEEDLNASSQYSKQRTTTTDQTIGATHVDERAPNINLRFFRQLGRGRSRRPRQREVQGTQQQAEGQESTNVRPMSNIFLQSNRNLPSTTNSAPSNRLLSSLSHSRFFNSSNSTPTSQAAAAVDDSLLISATLVEEKEVEYAIAEEMNWCQSNAKWLLPLLCCLVLVLVGGVTAGVMVTREQRQVPTLVPSQMPSVAPSMDRRPTIVNVQERGYVRCGLSEGDTPEINFRRELCRAIASVVLGNPNNIRSIDPFTFGGRWTGLQKGGIDVQITGDTHTIQREVQEELTFSTPYQYDGASYNGNATYVRCAYELKRYDECQDLYICVLGGTTMDYVSTHYSPEFYHQSDSWEDVFEWYGNGTCNVIAGDRMATKAQMEANLDGMEYVIGDKTITNEPLAIVTRNGESEWSDVVNWVMISMFQGEEWGKYQNDTLCEEDEPTVSSGLELNYNKSIYCVGNYREVFEQSFGEEDPSFILESQLDVLYVTPFGDIYDENADDVPQQVIESSMYDINTSPLQCGIVIQNGCQDGNITLPDNICGMSVDLCHTLAASIFYGDVDEMNVTVYPNETSALMGLTTEESVDVVLGMRSSFEHDFGTESVKGVTYSRPYFYGDETEEGVINVYSIATRDDDAIFSSYVNCILLATVYAVDKGITQERFTDMPTMTLYGNYYLWSLKDAIAANGNYNEIFHRNFGNSDIEA